MTLTMQASYYGISAIIATVGVVRYLRKTWRRKDIEHVFIRDMATNHLPHIYTALEIIADKVEAPLTESPRIKFLDEKDFEGK